MRYEAEQLDTPTSKHAVPAGLSKLSLMTRQPGMPEEKKQFGMIDLDDDLSEFERARLTSKTWSMGQD